MRWTGLTLLLCACVLVEDPLFGPVETRPPEVRLTLPMDGAQGVPVGVAVSFFFSEPLQWDTLGASDVRLQSGAVRALGRLDRSEQAGAVVHFVPDAPLLAEVTWTAELSTEVLDRYFNRPAEPHRFSFTTAEDPEPFAVAGFDPPAGQAQVPLEVVPAIRLTRAIPAAFADGRYFRLLDDADEDVPARVFLEGEGDRGAEVRIAPDEALVAGRAYRLEVRAGLPSAAAQRLESGASSHFETAP